MSTVVLVLAGNIARADVRPASTAPILYGPAVNGFQLGIRDDGPVPSVHGESVNIFLSNNGNTVNLDNGAFLGGASHAFQVMDGCGNSAAAFGISMGGLGSFSPPKFIQAPTGQSIDLESFVIAGSKGKLAPGQYSVNLQMTLHFDDGTSVNLTSGTFSFKV
jgi:hypothetical protein